MLRRCNDENQPRMATEEDNKKRPCCCGIPARYIFAILACFGYINIYSLRVNLSVAIVAMVNISALIVSSNLTSECEAPDKEDSKDYLRENGEFVWDEPTQGLILGSFYWGFIFTQIPGGLAVDQIGGKWLYGGGILITAVLSLLTPFATRKGVGYLMANRILQGLSQGAVVPALYRMISQWAPVNERCRFVMIIFSGNLLGTVFGMSLSGYLCLNGFSGGWPSAFYIFGAIGIVWFILWSIFVYENPSCHPWISTEEKNCINSGINREEEIIRLKLPWKKMLKSPSLWAVTLAQFGFNWGLYVMLNDLPTYLKTILHFDMKKNGLLSSLPYLICWLCGLVASILGDKLSEKKYLRLTNARKLFNSIGFLSPAALLMGLTFIHCNPYLSYAILTIAIGINGCTYAGYQGNLIDIAPNFAATLMGITNTVSTIGGIVSPYVVGEVTDKKPYQSEWSKVFYMTTTIYVVTGIFYMFFCKAEEQEWNKIEKENNNVVLTKINFKM